MNMAMVNSYMIYKVLVSTKPTKNKGVIQTDFGPILIEAMIAGTGNELLPLKHLGIYQAQMDMRCNNFLDDIFSEK